MKSGPSKEWITSPIVYFIDSKLLGKRVWENTVDKLKVSHCSHCRTSQKLQLNSQEENAGFPKHITGSRRLFLYIKIAILLDQK